MPYRLTDPAGAPEPAGALLSGGWDSGSFASAGDVATRSVSGEFGQIKLHNAGSFSDLLAIPPQDHSVFAGERIRS